MKELGRLLRKSEVKKRLRLLAAYICNLVLITLFLMISMTMDNVTNEKLNPNQYQQIVVILYSIIGVSIITIFFFQWIISQMFGALYESRRSFNISLRLIGMSKYKLYRLYFAEMFVMQAEAVPAGVALSFLLYKTVAYLIQLPQPDLKTGIVLLAVMIHIIVVLVSVSASLHKANKIPVIEMLRGKQERADSYKLRFWDYMKAALGIMLLCANEYLRREFYELSRLTFILAVILFQNVGYVVLNNILEKIGNLFGFGNLVFVQALNRHTYKRTKTIVSMMIFGVMMTVGLQAAYMSARRAVTDMGEKNIHYKNSIVLDRAVPLEEVWPGENLGLLKFFANSAAFPRIYLQGVNAEFLEKYETIDLKDTLSGISADALIRYSEDEDWNGIIFPQGQISEADVGRTFTASVGGVELEFVIEGGYYSNNYTELRCLVGNAYLQKKMGTGNTANIVFSLEDVDYGQYADSSAFIQSKEELVKDSAGKVIKSTELIELAVCIIFVSSLVMLLSYVYLLGREKELDYIRLRAAGMSCGQAISIFALHFGVMGIYAVMAALPCAGELAYAINDLTLGSYYLGGITYPYVHVTAETLSLLLLPVAVFVIFMRNAEKNMYTKLRGMAVE